MAWYHWVMAVLLVLLWSQYTNPEKTSSLTSKAFDPLNEFIEDKTSFNIGAGDCPITFEPVCGDNTTYANTCLAGLAGVTEVTPGECDG